MILSANLTKHHTFWHLVKYAMAHAQVKKENKREVQQPWKHALRVNASPSVIKGYVAELHLAPLTCA